VVSITATDYRQHRQTSNSEMVLGSRRLSRPTS
jgi:hypothetical protein